MSPDTATTIRTLQKATGQNPQRHRVANPSRGIGFGGGAEETEQPRRRHGGQVYFAPDGW